MDSPTFKLLKPLRSKFKPNKKKIIGFDIETHGKNNDFVLASIHFETDTITIFDKREAFEIFNSERLRKQYIFVATNLPFDFLGLVMEYKNYWKVSERKGHIYKFSWFQNTNKRNVLQFYDTINYFKASVETLGNIIGIPKIEHPNCFGKIPKNTNELKELNKYCENDANISRLFFKDFIIKYLNDNELKLKTTIASISLEDFRRNYLDKTYKVEPYRVHKQIFEAYYGGRTEVFKRGTFKNVNCYDVNSLYPSQMLKNIPDPSSFKELKKSSYKIIMNHEGVSYIEGVQPKTYIPVLPMRIDNKLIFPTGKIKGYYTHVEIRKAIEEGFVLTKIKEGVMYSKTIKIFRKFILDKYKKRLQQKKEEDPLELMTKLIMNSLYGKFAFNYRDNNKLVNIESVSEKELLEANYIEDLGNGYIAVNSESKTPTNYSFPIFSAYITAYARITLYEYLKNNKDNLIYCDTDSVFLKDGDTLPESNKLGEMKHEYNKPIMIFTKPKMYTSDKAKIKGCSTIKTYEDFVNVLENPIIKEERFTKYRSVIRSKEHHKNGILKINQMIQMEKKLSLEDTKRKWNNIYNYKKQENSKPLHI